MRPLAPGSLVAVAALLAVAAAGNLPQHKIDKGAWNHPERGPPFVDPAPHCPDLHFPGRYLLVEGGMAAGLDHITAELRRSLSLAVVLRRTLIVRAPKLAQNHKYEFVGGWQKPKTKPRDDHWDGYYGLDNSTVLTMDGTRQPLRRLACPMQAICSKEPAGWSEDGNTIEKCIMGDVQKDQACFAETYDEVERLDREKSNECPLLTLHFGYGEMMPSAGIPTARRDILLEVPAPALQHAGEEALSYVQSLADQRGGGRVFVFHVRRGDILRKEFVAKHTNEASAPSCGDKRSTNHTTSPDNIRHMASLVGAREDDVIYIMTNEIRLEHFAGLEAIYWHDVPPIKAVMDGRAGGDNYKLYALEKFLASAAGGGRKDDGRRKNAIAAERSWGGSWGTWNPEGSSKDGSKGGGGGNNYRLPGPERFLGGGGGRPPEHHHKHPRDQPAGGGHKGANKGPGGAGGPKNKKGKKGPGGGGARRLLQGGGEAGGGGGKGASRHGVHPARGAPSPMCGFPSGGEAAKPEPPRGSVLFLEIRKLAVCVGEHQSDFEAAKGAGDTSVWQEMTGACRSLGKPRPPPPAASLTFNFCDYGGVFCRYKVYGRESESM